MAKDIPKGRANGNASKTKAARATRYATLPDLKAAVREACIAEVDRIANHPGEGEHAAAHMVAFMARVCPADRLDPRPRRVWCALMQALAGAAELHAANPNGPWNVYEAKIAAYLVPERFTPQQDPLAAQRAAIRDARAALAADEAIPSWENRRTVIVHNSGRCWIKVSKRWGESPRVPTDREIAILSLLAGEFPEHAQTRQANAKKSKIDRDKPTVAEVIEAETHAINVARRRLEKSAGEAFHKSLRARAATKPVPVPVP